MYKTTGVAYNSWPGEPNFLSRKSERRKDYFCRRYGWRQCACLACNGSGKYDWARRGRIPDCSSCNGTGRSLFKALSSLEFRENLSNSAGNLIEGMIMLGYGDYII